ncbi:hypothetical protein R1flu_029115 [Riccia fluitans]|uniref:SAP domain-containing protein n=1 Tax=Riccia fluitans TaxID=41844 RepID=A0ABD1XNP7_9MARC
MDGIRPVSAYGRRKKSNYNLHLLKEESRLFCSSIVAMIVNRSGFHGTCPFINVKDSKVIEMITLTKKEASNSWKKFVGSGRSREYPSSFSLLEKSIHALSVYGETAEVERGIQLLRSKGVRIAKIVHDDNTSVDANLNQSGVVSLIDLRHKTKNITKKFREVLQDKKFIATAGSIDSAKSMEELALFSNQELKEWLRARKLRVSGNKETLCCRIVASLELERFNWIINARDQLQQNDIAYKLKSWIYTACHAAAKRLVNS